MEITAVLEGPAHFGDLQGFRSATLNRGDCRIMAAEPAMHRTKIMLPTELKERALREARSRGIVRLLSGTADDTLFADHALYHGPVPADFVTCHDILLYGPAKRQ